MKIDNMQVAIRPMSSMQAIDLGFMMARTWFLPLWQLWLGMALPVFLLTIVCAHVLELYLLSSSDIADVIDYYDGMFYSSVGFFVLWWFKPLYEKVLVAWLGKALFGEQQAIKTAIKEGYRQYFLHASQLLFRHRLSFIRQLLLPILMLEKPTNTQLKPRLALLRRGQTNDLAGLTILMVHVEFFFLLGIGLLFLAIFYGNSGFFINALAGFGFSEAFTLVIADFALDIVYFLVISVLAPFFICAGFAVYLTKRCLLEGWDIELVFKNLAHRYTASTQKMHDMHQFHGDNTMGKASSTSATSQSIPTSPLPSTPLPSVHNDVSHETSSLTSLLKQE